MFGIDYSLEDEQSFGRSVYFPDTVLQSPLQRERVAQAHEDAKSSSEGASLAGIAKLWGSKTAPVDIQVVMAHIFTRCALHKNNSPCTWSATGQEVAAYMLAVFNKLLPTPIVSPEKVRKLVSEGSRQNYSELSHKLNEFVLTNAGDLSHERTRFKRLVYQDLDTEVVSVKSAILIRCGDYWALGDYSGLLMLKDAAVQRHIVLQCCSVNEQLGIQDATFPSLSTIEAIYAWGDQILIRSGSAYDDIKNYESICIASVLAAKRDQDVGDPDPFIKDGKAASSEISNRLGVPNLWLLLAGLPVSQRLQAFGLFRHWGHPYVNVEAGIRKNRAVSEPTKTIDPEGEDIIELATRRMLFPVLKKYGRAEKDANPHAMSLEQLRAYDWRGAIPWREQLDMSVIFSDKACGLRRSELAEVLKKKRKGDWRKRRTLVQWISSPAENFDEVIDNLNKDGVEYEDLTIGVTPKERELKSAPRLFSLLTMGLKKYFGCTEALIAAFILPHIVEITMTDSLDELNAKQLKMTKTMIGNALKMTVLMNVDFEKWNLNMRGCQTRPCFKVLDELFDFGDLFGQTHDIFKKCLFYCFDGFSYAPVSSDGKIDLAGTFAWTNQEGGCEGLRQKGWTLWTGCNIAAVASQHEGKFQLLGQGDNQVPSLTYDIDEVDEKGAPTEACLNRIKTRFAAFKSDLIIYFNKLKMPIKWEESWSSSNFFIYGKSPIYRGSMMPTTLKRLSRCLPFANEDHPTLFSALAAIHANALNAAQLGHDIVIPLVTAMCCSAETIYLADHYHPLFDGPAPYGYKSGSGRFVKMQVKDTCARLLLGAVSVGGMPAANPLMMLHRGFSDPLTEYLTWAALCRKFGTDPYHNRIIENYSSPLVSTNKSYESLVSNPRAGNFVSADIKEAMMKRLVTGYFQTRFDVKNKDLAGLFGYTGDVNAQLGSAMSSYNSVVVDELSELYACSPASVANSLLAKITTTKTMRLLVKDSVNLRDDVAAGERRSLQNVLTQSQCTRDSRLPTTENAHELAAEIRDESWGMKLNGIKCPHPAQLLEPVSEDVEGPRAVCLVDPEGVKDGIWSRGEHPILKGRPTNRTIPQLHDHWSEVPSSKLRRLERLLFYYNKYPAGHICHDFSVAILNATANVTNLNDSKKWIELRPNDQDLDLGIPNILPTVLSNIQSDVVNMAGGVSKAPNLTPIYMLRLFACVLAAHSGRVSGGKKFRWKVHRMVGGSDPDFSRKPESESYQFEFNSAHEIKLLFLGVYDFSDQLPSEMTKIDTPVKCLDWLGYALNEKSEIIKYPSSVLEVNISQFRHILGVTLYYLMWSYSKKKTLRNPQDAELKIACLRSIKETTLFGIYENLSRFDNYYSVLVKYMMACGSCGLVMVKQEQLVLQALIGVIPTKPVLFFDSVSFSSHHTTASKIPGEVTWKWNTETALTFSDKSLFWEDVEFCPVKPYDMSVRPSIPTPLDFEADIRMDRMRVWLGAQQSHSVFLGRRGSELALALDNPERKTQWFLDADVPGLDLTWTRIESLNNLPKSVPNVYIVDPSRVWRDLLWINSSSAQSCTILAAATSIARSHVAFLRSVFRDVQILRFADSRGRPILVVKGDRRTAKRALLTTMGDSVRLTLRLSVVTVLEDFSMVHEKFNKEAYSELISSGILAASKKDGDKVLLDDLYSRLLFGLPATGLSYFNAVFFLVILNWNRSVSSTSFFFKGGKMFCDFPVLWLAQPLYYDLVRHTRQLNLPSLSQLISVIVQYANLVLKPR